MTERTLRHGLTLVMGSLMMASCATEGTSPNGTASPEATESEASPAERIVMAETAWLSVSQDGAVFTTFLDPDGRYRDLRNGEPAFEGAWAENPDGELCFTPDSGLGGCWRTGAPDDDGTMRARDDRGRDIVLKRITYLPPPAPEDEQGADDETEAAGG